jgi:hypothetical protein
MDTLKDRIEYFAYGRALTIKKLELELGLQSGTIEHCDQSPLTSEALEKVAKRLNMTPGELIGERSNDVFKARWKG